jgi:hypothetical protein
MTTTEAILQRLKDLPEAKQAEVLDFVTFLETRTVRTTRPEEDLAWLQLSLAAALRGMEDEPSPYTLDDLKESFR